MDEEASFVGGEKGEGEVPVFSPFSISNTDNVI